MGKRIGSYHAVRLAEHLSARTEVRVKVVWSSGWHVLWTDGPTTPVMRATAGLAFGGAATPARAAGFDSGALRYARGSSDVAEAASLLDHLARHPEDTLHADPHLTRHAFAHTEYPERAAPITLRRAQALIGPGLGTVTLESYAQLRGHGVAGGWPAIAAWLDRIVAIHQVPAPDGAVHTERAG